MRSGPRRRRAVETHVQEIFTAIEPVLRAKSAEVFSERLQRSTLQVAIGTLELRQLLAATGTVNGDAERELEIGKFVAQVTDWGGDEWGNAVAGSIRAMRRGEAAFKAVGGLNPVEGADVQGAMRKAAFVAFSAIVGWCWWAAGGLSVGRLRGTPVARAEVLRGLREIPAGVWLLAPSDRPLFDDDEDASALDLEADTAAADNVLASIESGDDAVVPWHEARARLLAHA